MASDRPHTDDGMPLLGVGGGDPALIRRRIAEAHLLTDRDERAACLYFLGRGLFDCDDPDTAVDAVAVLGEAMDLGSLHAALDLGSILLQQAETSDEVAASLTLLERAAKGGLVEAQTLLGRILMESPVTRARGQEWLRKAAEPE
jgi:TPR repeat protein